jgi:hypothetical protein
MKFAPHRMFDENPKDWMELERMVCQVFEELGYETHREQELTTVRGKVNVDVVAKDLRGPIQTTYLCECKYWSKRVDQNVVHAFRSVCADVGAHIGLIISKAGFQSGANETRDSTNIHLLSFDDFQNTFFERWRAGVFKKLSGLTQSFATQYLRSLVTNDPQMRHALGGIDTGSKYEMLIFGDQSYGEIFAPGGELPITLADPRGDPKVIEQITINSFRQYFSIAVEGAEDLRRHLLQAQQC